MPGIKELKTRIKSIGSTRKITRAMQLVSAAKMRKAQDAVLASRTYSSLAWELILNLSTSEQIKGELLKIHPQAKKLAIVILSSNRGLVGSLNSNLFAAFKNLADNSGLEADIVTYGRKGRDFAVRNFKEILADFEKHDRTISAQEIYPLSKFLIDLYKTGEYMRIVVIYNHYVSTLVQQPTVKHLLPFAKSILETTHSKKQKENLLAYTPSEYAFEPSPKTVMRHLLPRIVESQIYQTILESEASEQSARMVMMKNATEAAEDLIADLTLTYNKLRQNKITTELAEITAGKIALE